MSQKRPTIIGGAPPAPGALPKAEPVSVAPTVIGASRLAPDKPRSNPRGVSSMPGVRLQMLDVSAESLLQHFPGTEPAVLKELVHRLSSISLPLMDALACERLGRDAQQSCASAMDQCLVLMQADAVRNAQRHLARLREILLEVVQRFEPGAWGWLRRSSAQAKLESVRLESAELKQLLGTAHIGLERVRADLSKAHDAIGGLRTDMCLEGLAAQFLAEKVKPSCQAILLERALSLSKSEALLLQHDAQVAHALAHMAALSSAMHDTVWVQLPAWWSALAALPPGEWSDTQRYLVHDSIHSLLQRIQ